MKSSCFEITNKYVCMYVCKRLTSRRDSASSCKRVRVSAADESLYKNNREVHGTSGKR